MAPLPVYKETFEVAVASAFFGGPVLMSPNFYRFSTFAAGSYDWSISYHPTSITATDSIDLCLDLETNGGRATISSSVGLLDTTGTLPPVNLVPESPAIALEYDDAMTRTVIHWVPMRLLDQVQAWRYVKQGSLTFEWTITILSSDETPAPAPEPALVPVSEPELEPEPAPPAPAPAPTTHKVPAATDVTFSVGGELFDAHMFILALRSPVFKAELFGGTLEISDDMAPPVIVVEDMRPDVFQALLCYIYTDDLPPSPDQPKVGPQPDDNDMLYQLLVAADRYDVRGLKLLCQEILSRKVDVNNVAKMLAIAEDHHCSTLKDACVELMADSVVMKEVLASQGYEQLRMEYPLVVLDVLEKYIMFSRV